MQDKDSSVMGTLIWWATLVVAVLAVPSIGFIVSRLIPIKGIGELLIFILSCWFCTYLGMKLMHRQQPNKDTDPK